IEVERARRVLPFAPDNGRETRRPAEVAIARLVVRVGGIEDGAELRFVAPPNVESHVAVDAAGIEAIRYEARMDIRGVDERQPNILPAQVGIVRALCAAHPRQGK